jgi:hypothetical protein
MKSSPLSAKLCEISLNNFPALMITFQLSRNDSEVNIDEKHFSFTSAEKFISESDQVEAGLLP